MNKEIYRYILAAILAGIVVASVYTNKVKPEPPVEPDEPESSTMETDAVSHVAPMVEEPLGITPPELRENLEEPYDVPLDLDLQNFIVDQCEIYDIDPAIVLGMIQRETQFAADTIGDGGNSYGLMQIQPRWHQERMDKLNVTDLLNPYQNVVVGIDYLAELLYKYDGNMEMALMAYNAGPTGAYKNWFSKGIYSNGYSQTVVANSERIKEGAVADVVQNG